MRSSKLKNLFGRTALICALAGTVNIALPGYCCGPDFPVAIMVSGLHPDLPLKQYAAGNLGIVQAGYAKSYLIVAYRYWSGNPLDATEQATINNIWQQRLNGSAVNLEIGGVHSSADPRVEYFKLRAKALGIKLKDDSSVYDFRASEDVQPDGFANALKTLRALIAQFGQSGAQTKDWIAAQDEVFGTASGNPGDPKPAAADAPAIIKAQRAYQEAAAKFYMNNIAGAKAVFEIIAGDKASPLRDLGAYMAARCAVKEALGDDGDTDEALTYSKKMLALNPGSPYKADFADLCSALDYRNRTPAESLEHLTAAVLRSHNPRFGMDVGDLTFLLNENLDEMGTVKKAENATDPPPEFPIEKYDLTDWLITLHEPDETWMYLGVEEQKVLEKKKIERAKHALEMWRKKHTLPWLVAAASLNDLAKPANSALRLAVISLKPDSKAYLTARFYLIDALINSGLKTEARQQLKTVLSLASLSPSTRNLFKCQMLQVTASVPDYLQNIAQRPSAISASYCAAQLPDKWETAPRQGLYHSENAVIADTTVQDLNAHLPQSYWVSWANDKSIEAPLHAKILLAAWLRSKLLGRDCGLDDALVRAYPSTKKLMAQYTAAADGPEKNFALACLVLNNYGMSPYLEDGIQRHADPINEWDTFNSNFWLPIEPDAHKKTKAKNSLDGLSNPHKNFMGSKRVSQMLDAYSKPSLTGILSATEKKQVDQEQQAIWRNHPSHFLGGAVMQWAKSHPRDARVPYMLYSIVKLPRWSDRSDAGTKYSKAAYLLLHKQYPNSSWAQKAECYY